MVACATNNFLYISTDSGNTWTANTTIAGGTTQNWITTKISGDGSMIVACISLTVYRSTDNGVSWSTSTIPFSGIITNIALSNNGEYQLCSMVSSATPYVYRWNNASSTWSLAVNGTGPTFGNTCLAVSASGQYQVFTFTNSNVRQSSDFGVTFTSQPPALNYRFVVMSSDASGAPRVLLANREDGIYIYANIFVSTLFVYVPGTITTTISTISYLPIASTKSVSSPRIN